MNTRYSSIDDAVDQIIEKTKGEIILAIPLGLGKPNQLVNALYRQAQSNSRITLSILTALSLSRPVAHSDLERRFMHPFVDRVYGDYEELLYLQDCRKGCLPENISVSEFFLQPGMELNNKYTQQHYLNTNYTHAARDINNRKVNVLAQMLAFNDSGELSLSSNPEVTRDLQPLIERRRNGGETILIIGQLHRELPFMGNDAEVKESEFDILIDDENAQKTLISTPNMPVGMAEYFIGINASSLIKDGGTLQIGIGALGDAVAWSTLFRQNNNADYQKLLGDTGLSKHFSRLIEDEGGLDAFTEGLYVCSEMLTYGLFRLFKEGLIKRTVEDQQGRKIAMHGGFFLGPQAFYQDLRDLSEADRDRINMTNISFVNQLYGSEELKRDHRQHARFINTAFSFTLMGAAISDQVEDGRVLSGVGGQYNFVAQAHELEGARLVMLVRASREREGDARSNLLWSYGHNTIPRHLRDIVVTEYGIADLRSKTDAECIAAMLNIADSRFQEELMSQAKDAGKLPDNYSIPREFCQNYPAKLQKIYNEYKSRGYFPEFPLGCDFTDIEQELLKALGWLKENVKPSKVLLLARNSIINEKDERHYSLHLERMGLKAPQSLREGLFQHLLLTALMATHTGHINK